MTANNGAPAATAQMAKPATVAELRTALPDLVAELCASAAAAGATAERDRILGIEKVVGLRTGHAVIVSEMKADGKTTPEGAALRIVEAENAQIEARQANLAGVENITGAVAPAAGTKPGGDPPSNTSTPDGWKAEYQASAALQRQYVNADNYVAFKKAEASGKVRILGARRAV